VRHADQIDVTQPRTTNARAVGETGGRKFDDTREASLNVANITPWQPKRRQESGNEQQQRTDERIADALEKIARVLDEFAGVYLNARFHGKGTDRWSRNW
jgi:hypothetical protein